MSRQSVELKSVQQLAESVFEDKVAARKWMQSPNVALGGNTPIEHCESELGVQEVRRILASIEYGGVV